MTKITYKDAGVDIHKGYETVEGIKKIVKGTYDQNVLTDLGAFAGLYALDPMKQPVLVTGTDGVGTKLKIAQMMGRHDSIGEDLVAMCVNDVLCHGAKPLLFLDYFATGRLEPQRAQEVIEGIARGCLKASCALIGGETAEMPGMYQGEDYDLAGFVVGVAERDELITGAGIKAGQKVIGLISSGAHSNGYSLIRKVFFESLHEDIHSYRPQLGESLGEALLRPTLIYTPVIQALMAGLTLEGVAHITGGGFFENIPRVLPEGLSVRITPDSWPVPPLFDLIQREAHLEREEMFATFNMGIGMVLVVDAAEVAKALAIIKASGFTAYPIGEVVAGDFGVAL